MVVFWFSDTVIMMLPKTSSKKDNIEFVTAVKDTALAMFKEGLPIRGCIDYGDCLYNEYGNFLLGSPFIRAHRESEKLCFSGLVITDEALKVVNDGHNISGVVVLKVPIKGIGKVVKESRNCIQWCDEDDLLKDEDISEEQLRNNFQKTDNTESLFLFSYLDGEAADVDLSYMLYPIRGLLALVVVLCGMAMGLYFMQDEERGIFTWMPLNRTVWGSWLYLFPGLLDIGVAVLLALTFSGVFISLPMELGLMGLYLLMVTGFVDVLRRLVGKPVRLGAMIPLLVLVMLAVCPIFMGEPNIKWVQLLLPPYYYLNALHNVTYQWGMGIYVIVIGFIDFVLLKIQQRRTLGG
jgi:hypothetical protein